MYAGDPADPAAPLVFPPNTLFRLCHIHEDGFDAPGGTLGAQFTRVLNRRESE